LARISRPIAEDTHRAADLLESGGVSERRAIVQGYQSGHGHDKRRGSPQFGIVTRETPDGPGVAAARARISRKPRSKQRAIASHGRVARLSLMPARGSMQALGATRRNSATFFWPSLQRASSILSATAVETDDRDPWDSPYHDTIQTRIRSRLIGTLFPAGPPVTARSWIVATMLRRSAGGSGCPVRMGRLGGGNRLRGLKGLQCCLGGAETAEIVGCEGLRGWWVKRPLDRHPWAGALAAAVGGPRARRAFGGYWPARPSLQWMVAGGSSGAWMGIRPAALRAMRADTFPMDGGAAQVSRSCE